MQERPNTPPQAITAPRSGLVLGALFVILFALWAGSVYFSPLIFLFLLGLPLVPLCAYRLTRSYVLSMRQAGVTLPFLSIWSHTVAIFIFGTLVLMLPLYAYVRYMLPGVLESFEQALGQVLSQSPEVEAKLIQLYGRTPESLLSELRTTPVWTYLLSVMNMQVILGALLGIIHTLILRNKGKQQS